MAGVREFFVHKASHDDADIEDIPLPPMPTRQRSHQPASDELRRIVDSLSVAEAHTECCICFDDLYESDDENGVELEDGEPDGGVGASSTRSQRRHKWAK